MSIARAGFAEFFAGIGLVRLALEQVGWQCVFANEIDPKKTEIYRQNFPSQELVEGDIRDVTIDDVPADASLWTASFPCIDLSLAGNRRGLDGEHSGMFWTFADLLCSARGAGRAPGRILIENVVGFATSAGGADLEAALRTLSECGYHYDVVVVDARWFTPQSRPRLFVVAERVDASGQRLLPSRPLEFDTPLRPRIVRRFVAEHPDLDWGLLPAAHPPERAGTLGDILETDVPDELWWSGEATAKLIGAMSPVNRRRLDQMLASPRAEHATVYRRVRATRTMAEVRWDGLAGCLRTPRGGSSKQFLVEARSDAVRVRNLTTRECARLQGVPETFSFDVPTNQAWFGLGDAVCVPAVRWLAEAFCGSLASDPALALV